MRVKIEEWEVQRLIKLQEDGVFFVNPEYQRGSVWKIHQMLMLIDSVLRGYHIPLIYLRHDARGEGEYRKNVLEVIDGQQRINTLHGFITGMYTVERTPTTHIQQQFRALYDPCDEYDRKHFPVFLQNENCWWAAKKFSEFSEEQRSIFLARKVSVSLLQCSENESRDLFIRLQGGASLNEQEIRDAWPGKFCDLILQVGGKPQMGMGYEGHEFFSEFMNARPATDRGKTRQLAAQLLMLFLLRQAKGADSFIGTGSDDLDKCYHQHVGLNHQSPEVHRFVWMLDKLTDILGGNIQTISGTDSAHLILFADMLKDDYVENEWEESIAGAFGRFQREVAKAKLVNELDGSESADFVQIWKYCRIYKKPHAAEIQRRHAIFVRQMIRFMGGHIRAKNPEDGMTPALLEAIFYRDEMRCYHCGAHVAWEDADTFYLEAKERVICPLLSNHVLIHKNCPEMAIGE